MQPRERERGGVLLRFAEGGDAPVLAFIPATTAARVAALGSLVPVPGAPPQLLGIALADGAVVTVLRIGDRDPDPSAYEPEDEWPVPGARRAVVCRLGGIDVALAGGEIVSTGLFDAAPDGDGIVWRAQMVPALDVRALYTQAETATWAARATSTRPGAASWPARPITSPRPEAAIDASDAGKHAARADERLAQLTMGPRAAPNPGPAVPAPPSAPQIMEAPELEPFDEDEGGRATWLPFAPEEGSRR